jgi:hypothetical protein
VDYPLGTECPQCPSWRGKDRWAGTSGRTPSPYSTVAPARHHGAEGVVEWRPPTGGNEPPGGRRRLVFADRVRNSGRHAARALRGLSRQEAGPTRPLRRGRCDGPNDERSGPRLRRRSRAGPAPRTPAGDGRRARRASGLPRRAAPAAALAGIGGRGDLPRAWHARRPRPTRALGIVRQLGRSPCESVSSSPASRCSAAARGSAASGECRPRAASFASGPRGRSRPSWRRSGPSSSGRRAPASGW